MIAARPSSQVLEAGVVAVVGGLIAVGSFAYPWTNDGRIGPGFIPGVAGFVILASAAGLAFRRPSAEQVHAIPDEAYPEETGEPRRVLVVLAIIIAAVALVSLVGFVLACVAMVFLITYVIEKERIVPALLTSAVTGLLLWGLFEQFLAVPLPTGVIFGGIA